uniref:Uncharacterized protein n=2 Tax=Trichobilharzia regenti TaxID=157069 RepID=A0AA85J511_TRIRE|nr:unnamed protein product [Trichobilharzia regenti]
MMNVNSRSGNWLRIYMQLLVVLRPEYLDHSFNFSTSRGYENCNGMPSKRVNTNTAPVYRHEEGSQSISCRTGRKRARPSAVPSSSHYVSPSNPSGKIISYDSDSANSVKSSHDNSSSPCPSYVSKYSGDSTARNYDSRSHSRPSRPASVASTSVTRSQSHGQAEQIRRSRESITFALINAQLSKPPLSKVRDMYMSTRSGSGQANSSARTTKKANLSVVNAIISCRIRKYLIELREYIRRCLDALFSHMFEDYDVSNRDTLAADILGISLLPCSPECEYCPGIMEKTEHPRLRRRESKSFNLHPTHPVTQIPSTSSQFPGSLPHLTQPSISACPNQMPHPQILPRDSAVLNVNSENNICPNESSPAECHLGDSPDTSFNCKLSEYTFPESSALLERPLPSYHIDDSDSPNRSVELDSTSLQLSDDFDNSDWRANDVDFGPCKEELGDSDSLAFDSSSGTPSRNDDSFFDPAYDVGDLMHHFTMDKYPGLQLTISP